MVNHTEKERDRWWVLEGLGGMIGDMISTEERFLGWTVDVEAGGIIVMTTPWDTEIRVGVSVIEKPRNSKNPHSQDAE